VRPSFGNEPMGPSDIGCCFCRTDDGDNAPAYADGELRPRLHAFQVPRQMCLQFTNTDDFHAAHLRNGFTRPILQSDPQSVTRRGRIRSSTLNPDRNDDGLP
jgi:hypothetical protein